MDNNFEQSFRQDIKTQTAREFAAPAPKSTSNKHVVIYALLFCVIVALSIALVFQIRRADDLARELEFGPNYEDELDGDIYDENFEADLPDDNDVLDYGDITDTTNGANNDF